MRKLFALVALCGFIMTSSFVGISMPAAAHDTATDGRWISINHRLTMNCFPRGSVPTGKTLIRTCGGVKYKVVGGSLSTGAHRQAWKWVATPTGYWLRIDHRLTMSCFARGSVPTGKVMYRTCAGVKYKVVGGSLSTGAHRQAWKWVVR